MASPQGVDLVYIPAGELNEFPGNPRQRTEKVLNHLKKSLLEFGFVDPIVIWANAEEHGYAPNTVIGGHRRLDAYLSLFENGLIEEQPIPCVPVNLDSIEKAKALNVALNKIAEEFDVPALKDFLVDIDVGVFDIEVTGFEEVEVKALFDNEPGIPPEPSFSYHEQYGVIVVCNSEEEQERVYTDLLHQGYDCKVVTT